MNRYSEAFCRLKSVFSYIMYKLSRIIKNNRIGAQHFHGIQEHMNWGRNVSCNTVWFYQFMQTDAYCVKKDYRKKTRIIYMSIYVFPAFQERWKTYGKCHLHFFYCLSVPAVISLFLLLGAQATWSVFYNLLVSFYLSTLCARKMRWDQNHFFTLVKVSLLAVSQSAAI